MNIIYIGYEGFDTNNGSNHLIETMLVDMLVRGNSIIYINSHTTGNNPDIPKSLEMSNQFTSFIIKRKIVAKKNFIFRYIIGLLYSLKVRKVLKRRKFDADLAIIQSTPTAAILVPLITKSLECTLVFNSFDVFPDGLISSASKPMKIILSVLGYIQKKMYIKMDGIVVNSYDVKKTLMDKGINEKKLCVVYNWFDSNKISVKDRYDNSFMNHYSISKDKIIIQYAGNIGFTFDYKSIIYLAKKISVNKNIEIHIIGEGAFLQDLKNETISLNLSNIKFYPWQPINRIADLYSSCDFAIIPLRKDVIKYSFPSKSALLMALGKIVFTITEKNSVYYRDFNDSKGSFVYEINEIDNLLEKITELISNKSMYNSTKEFARLFSQQHMSSEKNLDVLYKFLQSIVHDKRKLK